MLINPEHDLTAELRELETQLSAMTPVVMPTALVDRMSYAIDDSLSFEDSDDAGFEELEDQLAQLGGAAMSEEMITRMANAMDRWHEELPVEEKLVPFGIDEKASEQTTEKASRKAMWATAAAVALLGALSALVIPKADDQNFAAMDFTNSVQPAASNLATSAPRDAWVVPDSLTHRVTNTTESGIVMSENNTLHRRIRIEYLDTVKVLDDRGREIEIERPSVEVVLLPVVTN